MVWSRVTLTFFSSALSACAWWMSIYRRRRLVEVQPLGFRSFSSCGNRDIILHIYINSKLKIQRKALKYIVLRMFYALPFGEGGSDAKQRGGWGNPATVREPNFSSTTLCRGGELERGTGMIAVPLSLMRGTTARNYRSNFHRKRERTNECCVGLRPEGVCNQ